MDNLTNSYLTNLKTRVMTYVMPPHDIDTWIFDLDNTLYPAQTNLFALIDIRMGQFISTLLNIDPVEARTIQKAYFYTYGTTLSGLMHEHAVDPHDFLNYVHDIALDRVTPSPLIKTMIKALPGRKLVFTNGDRDYAMRVLGKLDLQDIFDDVHDIHATRYRPKPMPEAYDSLCETLTINPASSLFIEDMARNLKPAKSMGMTTIWLNNGSEGGTRDAHPDYIDHEIYDLGDWLVSLKLENN